MAKKPHKSSRDFNALASSIVGTATGDQPPHQLAEKDHAAVELGKRGGKKGGPARAKALTAQKRREIAQKAARMRWDKGHTSDT
jgi:hypothetical protein